MFEIDFLRLPVAPSLSELLQNPKLSPLPGREVSVVKLEKRA